ncbi:hypothetical protein J4438_00810 [Candidatus Woesearchaeota archaeon]|nr:hypothetical protein [Candidatus Woesearchaeota archaeon]
MFKTNLEETVIKERFAKAGLLLGSGAGLIYTLSTQDNNGISSFLQSYRLDGVGNGALTGAGVGYCGGMIYSLIDKLTDRLTRL